MQLCEMECGPPDPRHMVVNIAGVKGRNCPSYHWVYLPSSRSGIHRIGFYSHVDKSFLPAKYRGRSDIVSIYAERSFASGAAPSAEEQVSISRAVVDELRDFEFINKPSWSIPRLLIPRTRGRDPAQRGRSEPFNNCIRWAYGKLGATAPGSFKGWSNPENRDCLPAARETQRAVRKWTARQQRVRSAICLTLKEEQ